MGQLLQCIYLKCMTYCLCALLPAGFWVKCLVHSTEKIQAHQAQQYVDASEDCCAAVLKLHSKCLKVQYSFLVS